MRILIVKLGAIGDVMRTTSILPGLKEKYPGAEIDWLTARSAKELLLNNLLIDRLFVWPDEAPEGEYDLVIGLEDAKELCQYVSAHGREVVGAFWQNDKPVYTSSGWFDMSLISKYGLERANELKKLNQKTYQQHLAEMLGIKVSPYVFSLSAEEVNYGRRIIANLGLDPKATIIGINTGAGKRWSQKSWGIKQTVELIIKLKREFNIDSLILGGVEEKERNQRLAKESGVPDAGCHSLRGFASIINQCSVLVSSDSLAMHFGIALKKRLVIFFGPTSAAEIELYGLGEKLTAGLDCLACYKRDCAISPNCMDRLAVDQFLAAVKRQLAYL